MATLALHFALVASIIHMERSICIWKFSICDSARVALSVALIFKIEGISDHLNREVVLHINYENWIVIYVCDYLDCQN